MIENLKGLLCTHNKLRTTIKLRFYENKKNI